MEVAPLVGDPDGFAALFAEKRFPFQEALMWDDGVQVLVNSAPFMEKFVTEEWFRNRALKTGILAELLCRDESVRDVVIGHVRGAGAAAATSHGERVVLGFVGAGGGTETKFGQRFLSDVHSHMMLSRGHGKIFVPGFYLEEVFDGCWNNRGTRCTHKLRFAPGCEPYDPYKINLAKYSRLEDIIALMFTYYLRGDFAHDYDVLEGIYSDDVSVSQGGACGFLFSATEMTSGAEFGGCLNLFAALFNVSSLNYVHDACQKPGLAEQVLSAVTVAPSFAFASDTVDRTYSTALVDSVSFGWVHGDFALQNLLWRSFCITSTRHADNASMTVQAFFDEWRAFEVSARAKRVSVAQAQQLEDVERLGTLPLPTLVFGPVEGSAMLGKESFAKFFPAGDGLRGCFDQSELDDGRKTPGKLLQAVRNDLSELGAGLRMGKCARIDLALEKQIRYLGLNRTLQQLYVRGGTGRQPRYSLPQGVYGLLSKAMFEWETGSDCTQYVWALIGIYTELEELGRDPAESLESLFPL
jgi:hypothetical protein